MKRAWQKFLGLTLSGVLALTGIFALEVQRAEQAAAVTDASLFDPGLIISDSVFFDFGTMNAAAIQRFIESKQPTCNDGDGGPKCLRDYYTDTPEKAGEDGRCSPLPAKNNVRASEIIYDVANACHINPRVLLVMLQKEQGLISGTNPTDYMYRAAMGYGCPDSDPAICGKVYVGLFNQLYHAAGQLQWYDDERSSFMMNRRLPIGKNSEIAYNPKTSCGTKSVLIKNAATRALYFYTPYTPNAAALANMYGLGDSCSAYGNRNFYRFYSDWFGSPIGGGFLLKSKDSETYLIVDNTKYLIEDTDLITAMKPIGPLGTVSKEYLESFETVGTVTRLIRSKNYLYLVDGGKKYTFSNCAQVEVFGMNCDAAVFLTDGQRDAMPTSGKMTEYIAGESGDTYFIQDGTKRQILDQESLLDSRIGVPELAPVKISALAKLPWGKPIIRKGVSFTNLGTKKLALFDGEVYYDIDAATAASVDFTKWFPLSTGKMYAEALTSVASNVVIKDIVADAEGAQYLITKTGKRKVADNGILTKNAPVVSAAFLEQIPDVATEIQPTVLVKASGKKDVYLVESAKRRALLNAADAAKYSAGLVSAKVETLSASAVAQIPAGNLAIAPGTYVKTSASAKTYLIDGFNRALVVPNANQAALLGIKNIKTVSPAQFKGYSASSKVSGLKFVCADKFYISITGKLYPVSQTDASHYPGRGLILDATTCSALTKSTSTLGRFVKDANSKYWLIEAGTKHAIASTAAYKKLVGAMPKAVLVGPYFLSKVPNGKAATAVMDFEPFEIGEPVVPKGAGATTETPSPSASPTPSVSPSPSPSPSVTSQTYVVVAGDTLSKIAKKFGTTVAAITAATKAVRPNFNPNLIKVGEVIYLS